MSSHISPRATWASVSPLARAIGYSVKPTGFGNERVAFPKGSNSDNPAAYFTDSADDMHATLARISISTAR
jgi:hypothetical protein